MPGTHNVLNCLAVIAVADELEVPLDVTKQALATFGGVARRFTIIGSSSRGITLVDDYGHHPAEIEATLDAAQRAYNRRVVVAFQPHRYTRTRDLFDEFTRAFNKADVRDRHRHLRRGRGAHSGHHRRARSRKSSASTATTTSRYVADKTRSPDELERRVRPGDVVIALGAGDINAAVRELKARLEGRHPGMSPRSFRARGRRLSAAPAQPPREARVAPRHRSARRALSLAGTATDDGASTLPRIARRPSCRPMAQAAPAPIGDAKAARCGGRACSSPWRRRSAASGALRPLHADEPALRHAHH